MNFTPNLVRIGLDAGHGGNDTGCVYNPIIEADYNLELVGLITKRFLDLEDWFTPYPLRSPNDQGINLGERGQRSSRLGCSLVVCIHVNAHAKRPDFHGAIGFHPPGDVRARKVANTILRCMPKPLHKPGWSSFAATNEAGEDDDWLMRPRNVLRPHWAHATTVLLEVGYASNEDDNTALRDPAIQEAIALAVVQGGFAFLRECHA